MRCASFFSDTPAFLVKTAAAFYFTKACVYRTHHKHTLQKRNSGGRSVGRLLVAAFGRIGSRQAGRQEVLRVQSLVISLEKNQPHQSLNLSLCMRVGEAAAAAVNAKSQQERPGTLSAGVPRAAQPGAAY